jgi:membrane protein DedA with SNARE-associated domain
MLEHAISLIEHLSPLWIYFVLFFFSFIENIFPPSPSDVVVVFGASLITAASGEISFLPVLLITSLGSSFGFMLMYYVGKMLGEKIIRTGKLKFISPEAVSKTDIWFSKWGFKLIAANRFLPGTRSVISFFAGLSELSQTKTFIMANISAFAWNLVLIMSGIWMGKNYALFDKYFSLYGDIITGVTILIVIYAIIHYLVIKKRNGKK